MPLYTYISTFKGATYVAQRARSNFGGFPDWLNESIPSISEDVRKSLAHVAYSGFVEVPNRKHVWRKSVTVDGHELVVVAVQTDS